MQRILLTEEQASLFSATETVEICNPRGHVMVTIPPLLTSEELAKIRRAKDSTGPRYSGEEVRAALKFLEDAWIREGPFAEERRRELLNQWRAERG
jgi:hypothetical protein